MSAQPLAARRCQPRKGAADRIEGGVADSLLPQVPLWLHDADDRSLSREFLFPDYHHTMAFVNAVAWIAHREDHHPDLEVGYSRVRVRFSTHDVGGLSLNDFIAAAKVDALSS